MKVQYFVPVLLAIFLSIAEIFAGTTGKIVGVVKDKTSGEGLIGVNILLEGTTLGATTDLDGSYLILNIPPGTYTLVFEYIGYREVRVSGTKVGVDFTTTVNAEMEEATIELGETIEVVAEREVIRKDLTASQAEITAEDIASIPSDNFADVLQLQAGISKDDQGHFHIRGGRSSEVAYWVDGVSVTDAYDGSNAVEIENNAIQNLKVISGTFNAEYGQAMSGIINIVTKEGSDKFSGQVSAYVGDYVTNKSYGESGNPFDPTRTDQIYLNLDEISPTHIYNFQANLDGPVPLTDGRARFFVNFRRNYDDGWLYGQRRWIANSDSVNNDPASEDYNKGVPIPGDGAYVPLNFDSWYSGQATLSYRITNLVKLQGKFNYEDRRYREYDQYYKYDPDGDLKKFQYGYNVSLSLDQTISSRTFYNIIYSYLEKNFKQYVYENPTDSRYIANELFSVPANSFAAAGQNNQHFNRNTQMNIAKFDITSQVSRQHLIKGGVEARLHRVYFLDYNIINKNTDPRDFVAIVPPDTNVNYNEYTFKPVEFSVYLQDKMEYQDFIVNLGLRFDYFDSKGRVLRDPKDPNIRSPLLEAHKELTLAEREQIWYDKPSPKLQFSPRVGVAYPISARGVIHASYGHFLQIPEFRLLYENPQFNVTLDKKTDNKIGNANLDAQRTIMYEIGLQQELTNEIGMDITGFYRDVRGWVGTSPLKETYNNSVFYSQYENQDYANVRGITFALSKRFASHLSANLDYTFQVAEGNASDPDDAFNDIKNNKEPRKSIIPLNWDRRHILNGNVYLGFGSFGVSLLGRFETGLPYTPQPGTGVRVGTNIPQGLRDNSGRRPTLTTFDLQLFKDLMLSNMRFSLFAKIFNLFDTPNEQEVYNDTGRATYTILTGTYDPEYIIRPDYYSQPRRIQFGFSVGF